MADTDSPLKPFLEKKRPTTWAVRLTGGNIEQIKDWGAAHGSTVYDYPHRDGSLSVPSRWGGDAIADQGDWLVVVGDWFDVMTDVDFRAKYKEQADERRD